MRHLILVCIALAAIGLVAGPSHAGISVGEQFYWPDAAGTSFTVDALVRLYLTPTGTMAGPFSISVDSGQLGNAASNVRVWCLEENVNFSPGVQYVATLDDLVYSGGLPGVTGLSAAAVRMYNEYLENGYGNYNRYQIRDTIWFNQGQIASNSNVVDTSGLADPVYPADFQVMNLWTVKQVDNAWVATDYQSQIIKVPTPAALVLGFVGLGLVGWRARKYA